LTNSDTKIADQQQCQINEVVHKKVNKQYVKALTLLTRIREMLGSSLGKDTDIPDWDL